MSGRVALSSEPPSPRLLVLDGDASHEVFEVVASDEEGERDGDVIRARSALLFEVGEQLNVRIEQGGSVWQATARVRSHAGEDGDRITELEIFDRRIVVG